MGVITMPHTQGTTITNIPTITGIMGDMATVITRPLGLTMVGAIMAVILLMDGIMVAVIRLMEDIMAVAMVVIEAVTAGAIMVAVLVALMAEVGGMAAGLEAAFTVATDKTAIFLSRISGYICDNGVRHSEAAGIIPLGFWVPMRLLLL